MSPAPEPVVVLQEQQHRGEAEREGGQPQWCPCGGEVTRGFDPVMADHIRLLWMCNRCYRIYQIAAAVVLGGSTHAVSADESEQLV